MEDEPKYISVFDPYLKDEEGKAVVTKKSWTQGEEEKIIAEYIKRDKFDIPFPKLIEDLEKYYNTVPILKEKEIYSYKDKEYILIDEIQVKNKETREWETFIEYRSITFFTKYAREKSEFYKLFKKI